MKRLIALLMSITLILCFAACSKGNTEGTDGTENNGTTKKVDALDVTEHKKPDTTAPAPGELVPAIIDKDEGEAYKTIVAEQKYSDVEGESVTKEGIFTTILYQFDGTTRYYVWGYSDKDMKDCWQWELNVKDPSNLPKNGSRVVVTGSIEYNEGAMDKIWLKEPSITVKEAYNGETFDVDMATMSPTLARVEVMAISSYKDAFDGKTISAYGKIITANLLGHPTDDNGWQIHFSSEEEVPEKGTHAIVTGVISDGIIENAKVAAR